MFCRVLLNQQKAYTSWAQCLCAYWDGILQQSGAALQAHAGARLCQMFNAFGVYSDHIPTTSVTDKAMVTGLVSRE